MNLKTYMQQLGTPARRKEFAKRAKTSVGFLDHVVKGRKTVSSLDLIVRLIEASDGDLDLRSLRPDLFPKNKAGERRFQFVQQSLAA